MGLVIAILICSAMVWLIYIAVFRRFGFIWEYEDAEVLDLKEFKAGLTLEEAHKHRDKVLKKYYQY